MKKTAALLPLLAFAAAASAAPYGAGFYDTSEYMMGKVAVNVVFVQSDGSVDARTETNGWTLSKRNAVMNGVQNAMAWWAARNSAANLSFVYDNTTVTTGYEPISRPSTDEGLWVTEVMGKLGYSEADYFDRVTHYDNDKRAAAGSDWAFTIFLVDSENDPDGEFSDNAFAYAYIGGPFMIMTYDNDNYGISELAPVAAHETGHIFYALDEYASAACSTADHAGYLNGYNTNCENGGGSEACIMRGDTPPYYAYAVCSATSKMLGWTDANSNGKIDILDLPPNTALTAYSPDPTSNTSPVYSGLADSTAAYTNSNTYDFFGAARTAHNISINKIAAVEYNVDSAGWQSAAASDGTFDGNSEPFSFTAASLGTGAHTVQARALDIFGAYDPSPASDSLYVDGGQAQDIPYVYDGTGVDVDYTRVSGAASANWGASYHSSGINRYEYAVGTSPGASDTVGWTSAGTSQYVTKTGLALSEGVNYYFSVRAVPNVGTVSGTSSSDGFKVDKTSPTAKVALLTASPAPLGPFSAKLTLTEANAVSGAPQLSFRTSTGRAVPLTLSFLEGSTWTAAGYIESYYSTGTATFQFSGFDAAGNEGTAITSGGTFQVNGAITGASGGSAVNDDGMGAVLPAGAHSGTFFVTVDTVPASELAAADSASPDSRKIYSRDLARQYTARDTAGTPITAFSSPVTLRMTYPDADSDGRIDTDLIKESTAWIYYLDPSAGKWTPLPGVTRDTAANLLTAEVSHFSVYSVRAAGGTYPDISALKAYPNPCYFHTTPLLTIEGIPADAAGVFVYIYNEAGELVRALSRGGGIDGLNVASWDGRDSSGAKAASGLYIYLVRTSNYGKATGKVFIVW